jgi:hypothetical protein
MHNLRFLGRKSNDYHGCNFTSDYHSCYFTGFAAGNELLNNGYVNIWGAGGNKFNRSDGNSFVEKHLTTNGKMHDFIYEWKCGGIATISESNHYTKLYNGCDYIYFRAYHLYKNMSRGKYEFMFQYKDENGINRTEEWKMKNLCN